MLAVADLPDYAAQLNAAATNPSLDPADRVAEVRRVRDRILDIADPDDPDARALLGQADTYVGDLELQREAGAMGQQLERAHVRESADIRDVLISQGVASSDELDAAGWPSHDSLDAGTADGTLAEGMVGAFAEVLHPRDRKGEWRDKPGVVKMHGRGGGTVAPAAKPASYRPPTAPPSKFHPAGSLPPDPRNVPPGTVHQPMRKAPAAPQPGPAAAAAPAPAAAGRAATDHALAHMFAPEETQKAAQHFGSPEALFKQAEEDYPGFQALLTGDGLQASLGAHAPATLEESIAEALTNATERPETPQVVMGPMKQMERAKEKVDTKYGGDWDRLQDVLRATVVVPSLDHMPAAVEAIRAHAEKHGWQVRKAENRYADDGQPHNVGPTGAGYRDAAVALVSPGGVVSELQINTAPMFEAKQGEGHHMYEESRSIEAGIKKRMGAAPQASQMSSPGGPTADELAKLEQLEGDSKALYHRAWEASYG